MNDKNVILTTGGGGTTGTGGMIGGGDIGFELGLGPLRLLLEDGDG